MKNSLRTRVPSRPGGLTLFLWACVSFCICATADPAILRGQDNDNDDENDNDDAAHFQVSLNDCGADNLTFSATRGSIRGFAESDFGSFTSSSCRWKLEVPVGPFISLTVDWVIAEPCVNTFHLVLSSAPVQDVTGVYAALSCHESSRLSLDARSVFFRMEMAEATSPPPFKITFQTAAEPAFRELPIEFTSDSSGFVTSHGYSRGSSSPCNVNASRFLHVPPGHVVMLSLARYHAQYVSEACPHEGLEVFSVPARDPSSSSESSSDTGKPGRLELKRCGMETKPAPVLLLNTSLLVRFESGRSCDYHNSGFKLLFSIHPEDRAPPPPPPPPALFDCSDPEVYARFKQHVHCNLEPECAGGEDEGGHCPFSNHACNGSVAVGSKCYEWVSLGSEVSWPEARSLCRDRGWDLATMKTPEEWEAFRQIYGVSKHQRWAWIGLRAGGRAVSAPYYSKAIFWADGTVARGFDVLKKFQSTSVDFGAACGFSLLYPTPTVRFDTCIENFYYMDFICERVVERNEEDERVVERNEEDERVVERNDEEEEEEEVPSRQEDRGDVVFPTLKNPADILTRGRQRRSLIGCPGGHVTLDFLACDPASGCWRREEDSALTPCLVPSSVLGHTVLTEMFRCADDNDNGNGTTAVPHNLVCDFRQDCSGSGSHPGSDESFCQSAVRPPCPGFTCSSGQCLADAGEGQPCDGVVDCVDGSDEKCDMGASVMYRPTYAVPPPAVVFYDKDGNQTEVPLVDNNNNNNNTGEEESCPDTHFRCSGDGYCLPVYVRCNGVADCPDHEDEAGCRSFSCPGFYRCRASRVCLHADHLCDGWPQCPQRDDELFCHEADCPPGCLCQGRTFICQRPFVAKRYPDLRYLDAGGSRMAPRDFGSNVDLVWLGLASCRLRYVTEMALPLLRTLDLSRNEFASLDLDVFLALPNLRQLRLSGNPLVSLLHSPPSSHPRPHPHPSLRSVDLSFTRLSRFYSEAFVNYPRIKRLNLSFSSLDSISSDGFAYMGSLEEVDLRAAPLGDYPRGLLTNLSHLAKVFSDDYRLCCEENLPAGFDATTRCHAPADVISSCEDLLRSDVHRALLWAFCLLAMAGNATCLAVRLLVRRTALSDGFNVLVTNLNLADLLMGVYLALVGAGDLLNRGRYLSLEERWLSGAACKAAGVLFLLSRETSVFLVGLITLDRLLRVRFPGNAYLLHASSSWLSCGAAWGVSFLLAVFPALLMPRWDLLSHNGLCAPLPFFAGKAYEGRGYVIAVVVVLNFLLSLLSAAGETLLYWASCLTTTNTNNTTITTANTTNTTANTAASTTTCSTSFSASANTEELRTTKEMTRARRVTTIVASHCLCWLVLGALGMLTATSEDRGGGGGGGGVHVNSDLTLSVVVLVLPLSSALNPGLYAVQLLAEKRRKGREGRLRRRLETARRGPVTTKSALGMSSAVSS